mmetsp:Transcript_16469/g.28709  ORF Transcript_16469/g.28709 Transcript_16469/m.28709 type:complete len:179 (-) Transcript_16469:399-935(-)
MASLKATNVLSKKFSGINYIVVVMVLLLLAVDSSAFVFPSFPTYPSTTIHPGGICWTSCHTVRQGGPMTKSRLQLSQNDDEDNDIKRNRDNDIVNNQAKVDEALGIERGLVLLAIALLINIWFFTIPTEFRRTRICNEFDSAAYPELCMTAEQFKTGISDYYKNGGGIKFDFSIQGRE